MLALDSSIGCIEASESEILDLYRSAPVVKSSSAGSKHEPMEAYVCAIKKKTQIRVYLALVADDRKIFVYTTPGKPETESGYRHTLDQAVACARAMGFPPEPVDLSYSPAMREVVVRNTKILRPPGSKAAGFLKHGMSGAPALPLAEAQGVEPPVTSSAASSVATVATAAKGAPPVAPPDQAAAVAAKAQAEKVVQLERTIAELIKQLQALTAERDAQSAQLGEFSEQRQVTATELAGAREECDRLNAEREGLVGYQRQCEVLVREKETVEEKLEQLAERYQGVVGELAGAREECARLLADKDAMVQAVNDAENASRRLFSLENEFAELSGRHLETDRICLELRDQRTALAEALALARRERDAAAAERDERLQKAERLVETAREAGVEMEALLGELAALRGEKEDALQRVDAVLGELEALRGEKEHVLQRVEVLEQQKGAAEEEPDTSPTLAVHEAEFPDFTLEQNVVEQNVLQEGALETSAVGSGADPVPAPLAAQLSDRELEFAYYSSLAEEAPASDAEGPEFPSLDEQAPDLPVPPVAAHPHDFPPLADLQSDFFAAPSDESALRFLLDPKLSAIQFSDPEEVLELHQSINNANLAPDGKGQENCRGYICCLKRGKSLLVFAAIHGTKSGRTTVYLPEEQPRDDASYASTVRGAIAFAEEVGLMMEPVMLDSPSRRDECTKRCPALRRTGRS